MNNDTRRFARLGLALSGVGLLALIVLLFIKGMQYVGLYTPPDPDLLVRLIVFAAAVTVLGLAAYAFLDPDKVRTFISGRQARYGSNSLIMLIGFLGILFVVNLMAFQSGTRWDVTEDKARTLAPETINTMAALPEPVLARAFYSNNASPDYARQLLDDFKAASNGKFDYEFINPDLNPLAAQEAEIASDGTVVLYMGGRHEQVSYPSEQDLASAMVRLINPEKRVVYFLVGHGEKDTETAGDTAMTKVKQTLEAKNYTVETLNLSSAGKIPADAKAIVIAGPTYPITAQEAELLDAYLSGKGSVVMMFEPTALTEFKGQPDPMADMLQSKWGIKVNNDFIIDPATQPPLGAVAEQYGQHLITSKLNLIRSVYPTTRSLAIETSAPGITATPLVITSSSAWGETDFASIENNTLSFGAGDTPGPLMVGIAAENTTTQARLVVFGDSDFATDPGFDQYANGDMLINSVDWAAGNESVISLTPKNAVERTFIPPPSIGVIGIFLFSLCILPLGIIGGGVAAWISRRRRG
jgi:ABC-type uncharacterized transport system involved in gliding motility auxiliary subunit